MKFDMQLDKRFKKSMRASFNGFDIQVGILKDKPYLKPKRWTLENETSGGKSDIGEYAGGMVRKTTRQPSGKTVADVSEANRKRLGFNYLSRPFERKTAEVVKFLDVFFNYAFGKSTKRRLENTLQACVRNPILRGEYGPQSDLTTTIKGFDRPMIDTAQLFKNIKASAERKRITNWLRGR